MAAAARGDHRGDRRMHGAAPVPGGDREPALVGRGTGDIGGRGCPAVERQGADEVCRGRCHRVQGRRAVEGLTGFGGVRRLEVARVHGGEPEMMHRHERWRGRSGRGDRAAGTQASGGYRHLRTAELAEDHAANGSDNHRAGPAPTRQAHDRSAGPRPPRGHCRTGHETGATACGGAGCWHDTNSPGPPGSCPMVSLSGADRRPAGPSSRLRRAVDPGDLMPQRPVSKRKIKRKIREC